MKKWLLLKSQGFSYNASEYFVQMVERTLTEYGYEVWVRPYSVQNASLLSRITRDHEFEGILEFGSRLPRIKNADGVPVVDTFNCPFYSVVLDHPLYMHECLSTPCKNLNVFVIDGHHKAYIEKYYPHVNKVIFLPIGTEIIYDNTPLKNREIEIFFPATFNSPDKSLEAIKLLEKEEAQFTLEFIDFLKQHEELTMERALRLYLSYRGEADYDNARFAATMNHMFMCDSYMAAYERERVVTAVIEAGFPITLVGKGWKNLKQSDSPNVTILDAIQYPKTLEIMNNSKIVLNVSPYLKDGIHDRVPCALGRGCVSLTDETSGILREFESDKELLTYDILKPHSASAQLEKIWGHWDRLQSIADEGFEIAAKLFSWNQSISKVLSV